MKSRLKPVAVGSFVVGTFALVIASLLSFRSCRVFSRPGRFVSYFNESVQGLDVGSTVKMRGVKVGRVLAIRVHYDTHTRLSQVDVVAELDRNVIGDRGGKLIQIADRTVLERLVDEGLRAKIGLVGITGLQYVELDFLDPARYPAPLLTSAPEYPVVPTIRSGLSELSANLSKIVGDIDRADVVGLSRELKALLANANRQLGDLDLKRAVARVAAAADAIESLAGSVQARAAITNLNETAADVRRLVAKIDAQVEPMGSELTATLESLRGASEGVRSFMGPGSGLGDEAERALRSFAEAAESVQGLADLLERDPGALIAGKRRPAKQP